VLLPARLRKIAAAYDISRGNKGLTAAMAHDVFISHSSADKAAADATCAALEAHGVACWLASRDILPSADWGASIVRAIGEAKVFLLIFSASANVSPHVTREVERAVNRGLPIIPVRIEEIAPGASLEYFLNTPHWLDAYRPPFEQHLDYVVRVVRLLIDGADAAAPVRPSPALPPPTAKPKRPWLVLGSAVALGAIVAAVAGLALLAPHAPPLPPADSRCLTLAPSLANPADCAAMMNQALLWQGCAAGYADGDMASRVSKAAQMIRGGRTGVDLYSASPEFRDYGAISHYWEVFGVCVNEGDVDFDTITGSVSFPDAYWMRTRPLRRVIGANWNGAGKALPDFMSNFHALCLRYKAGRDKARPGGGQTLDCSL
jgi:hypothetical protein